MEKVYWVTLVSILVVLIVGIFFVVELIPTASQSYQFKPVLNLVTIQNSSGVLEAMQNGTNYYPDFNITYSGSATPSSNPLFPIKFSAILSIFKTENILEVALSTQNPNILLNPQQSASEYVSVSEYNGTGFLLCTSAESNCQYKKANQNGDFAAEIVSSLSNLFSSRFLSSPYLTFMSENYNASNSTSFSLSYLNMQTYDGNQCANMQASSTPSFTSESGLSINGQVCLSTALGLPLYGQFTVTYDSVNIALSFTSVLTK
jgi:hypothetical protein